MIEEAVSYLGFGLQPIPAIPGKRPFGEWKTYQTTQMDEATLRQLFAGSNITGTGILCGDISGNLEVIDVDCKYDLTGRLFEDLRDNIAAALPDLIDLLVIGTTPSGGYHIYYRCDQIDGNKKLARRPPTAAELEKNPNEKALVLIETRGQGGFIMAPPSEGYRLIQGHFDSIPTISTDDRATILAIARSFNLEPEQTDYKQQRPQASASFDADLSDSPFAAYNQRGDVVALLQQHGWTYVFRQGPKVHLKRPGQSTAKTSGNFHEELRKFYVWTSSSEFDSEKAHSPSDVFIQLECNGDKSLAARRLLEMGYGSPRTTSSHNQEPTQVKAEKIRVEGIDKAKQPVTLVDTNLMLKVEDVKAVDLESVYIYYVDEKSEREVVQVLNALDAWTQARIYIRQVLTIQSNDGESLRPYEFLANRLFRRYTELYQKNGGHLTAEEEDRFFEKVHDTGASIKDPVDRDRFRQLVLRFGEANELGINEETLREVTEKIRYNRVLEESKAEMAGLLERARSKQEKGDLSGTIEILSKGVEEVKGKSSESAFSSFLIPSTQDSFAVAISNKPDNLKTGYIIEGQELLFPAGAISIVAAPTNHGKTTFLINCLLRVSEIYPDKNFYFLSYEEDADSVTVSTFSTYIGKKISENNRASIRSYYRDGQAIKWINQEHRLFFEEKKNSFFSELIETGRVSIRYVDLDSTALCSLISFLSKHGNAGGFFIDYIQLLQKSGFKGQRDQELMAICSELKNVSVDTRLPVILGAQFTREVTTPQRMHVTKIADASGIEKYANLILAFYNLHKKPFSAVDQEIAEINAWIKYGDLYVEILKQRSGRSTRSGQGECLLFEGSTGIITNRKNEVSWNSTSYSPPMSLTGQLSENEDGIDF